MRVLAVLLAAGASRRLGQPKQLLPYRGRPLIRAVAEEACKSTCAAVLVVVGASEERVRPALDGLALSLLSNPEWSEGMASSVRCAAGHAERGGLDAVVLLVCDQPALSARHIDALVAAHEVGASVVASRYGGVLGVPALVPRALFPELRGLRGDEGAKHVIRSAPGVVAIDWPEGANDIDVLEDAARLEGHSS